MGAQTLCDRQHHPCAKLLRMNGAAPPPLHVFTACTRTLPPPLLPFILLTMSYSDGKIEFPARTIHRCVEILLKCTARIYCRSPFRNTAICQASSTRSVCLSVPLYPLNVLSNVSLHAARIASSFTCQRTCKTLRPGTQNWSSRVHNLTLGRP
jgi:hypothetical protein